MREVRDWRCQVCGKLLGRESGGRLHIRFSRGHEYRVARPVSATCQACGALNELIADGAAVPIVRGSTQ